MPREFEFPRGVDLWLPFATSTSPGLAEDRSAVFLQAVGRLNPGFTMEQAEAEMNAIIARVAADHPETEAEGHRVVMTPLPNLLLGNVRHALWLLLAATGFLLLIASANVANLLLARATTRRRELALRASLGASRFRLARQLAVESAVLALLGGALGVLLAKGLTLWLVTLTPSDIPRIEDVRLQGTVLAFAVLVSLLTACFFGLAPSWLSAGSNLSLSTRDRRGKRARGALIVGEVAVAVVLLCGGALLLRSLVALTRVDLGLEPGNVLTMQLRPKGEQYRDPEASRRFFRQLVDQLESQPGVLSASAVLIRPLEGTVGWDAEYEGEGQSREEVRTNPIANFEVVTPHYFDVFGIPFRSGREFTPHDTMDSPRVVIVSESLSRRLFGSSADAIGKRLKLWPGDPEAPFRTVVGVVSDVRYRELEEARLDVYVPLEQSETGFINHIALRTASEPATFLPIVRREVASLDPFQAVSGVATMEELVAARVARPRFNAVLLNWLSAFALLLAVVGVHGVVAYSTAERTSELGLRMALGADGRGIVRLVIGDGMRPVLAGVAIGLAAAFLLGRSIAALLFEVSPSDPPTFLGVGALLAFAALLACFVPAVRAAKLDPVDALRKN
jgi:predicted permease